MKHLHFTRAELQNIPGFKSFSNFSDHQVISSIATDSRKVSKTDFFICLKGEKHDAHEFLPAVLKQQVGGIIVDETTEIDTRLPVLKVDNTNTFLGSLAALHRRKNDIPVIAITGSNGKTSVKNLIHHIFASFLSEDQVLSTAGNLNNHFGVPYTLLKLKPEHRVAVIEAGMNSQGEIRYLSDIIQADLAVITQIAAGHIGFFESTAAIAEEKSDIVTGLREKPGRTRQLIVPQNLKESETVIAKCKKHQVEMKWISANEFDIALAETDTRGMRLLHKAKKYLFHAYGMHQLQNLRLALAAVWYILDQENIPTGMSHENFLEKALSSLEKYENAPGRMRPVQKPGGLTIWDDCYNANPGSFDAALEFVSNAASRTEAKKAAIVGHMAELGDASCQYHRDLAQNLANKEFTSILFVTDDQNILKCFKDEIESSPQNIDFSSCGIDSSFEKTVESFLKQCNENTYILLKGSRSSRLERILDMV